MAIDFHNARIARHHQHGTEVLGCWIVQAGEYPNSSKMDQIRRELAIAQAEEPEAGWRLEFCGSAVDWHEEMK